MPVCIHERIDFGLRRLQLRIARGVDQRCGTVHDFLDPVIVVELQLHIAAQTDDPIVNGDDGGRFGIVHQIQARVRNAGVEPRRTAVLREADAAPGVVDIDVRTRIGAGFGAVVWRRFMQQVGGVYRVCRTDAEVIIRNTGRGNMHTGIHSGAVDSFIADDILVISVVSQIRHRRIARGNRDRLVRQDSIHIGNLMRNACCRHIGDLRNKAGGLHQHVFNLRILDLIVKDIERLRRRIKSFFRFTGRSVDRVVFLSVNQIELTVARFVIDGRDRVLLDFLHIGARFFDRGKCAPV